MEFRTEVNIPPTDLRIGYRSGTLMMGSCFTENIGWKLEDLQFPADVNPFGICYNPSSLSRNLWSLMDRRKYTREDLDSLEGLWFSYDHHGEFSDPEPSACLDRINTSIHRSNTKLENAKVMIITWGTAMVYVHRETASVVSNCHKVPAGKFQRHLLPASQIVDIYSKLFARIRKDHPGMKVILTVSPVRHWKDGAGMNSVSKATLILAAHQLCERFSYCEYFPAYEIAMDDLRDYRFYNQDMLHPNSQMQEYIWEKFSGAYFDAETRQIASIIQKIASARKHRPFRPDSGQYLEFCRKQLENIARLREKYPFLDLEALEIFFSERLKSS